MITGKHLIDGHWTASGSSCFHSFNPTKQEFNPWSFFEAGSQETNQAVQAALRDFQAYKELGGMHKARFLEAIAHFLDQDKGHIVDLYMTESGLPQGRAEGELGRTTAQIRMFAALLREGSWVEATIDTADPGRSPVPKPDIRNMLIPLGPVAVFGASNFPLAFSTAGGDTISALAAGCPVIVKGHPFHPATGELVANAILKAMQAEQIPLGVFANLQGSQHSLGESLVSHPGIRAVGFTGSFKGGTALHTVAQLRKDPIPVFAEMGSVNPVILMPSALGSMGSHWASQLAASVNLGAGQFCTNPGLLIAQEGEALNDFVELLAEAVAAQPAQCMLHPNIHQRFTEGIGALSGKTTVMPLSRGQHPATDQHGVLTINRVKACDFLQDDTLMEEVFGPSSLLVSCADAGEREAVLKKLPGQLSITLLGSEEELQGQRKLLELAGERAGRLLVNGVPTGVEVCPSMQHGGPYPATTDSRFTSVGTGAIRRWVRPVAYQNLPESLLPEALKNSNPLNIFRTVNGKFTKDPILS